MSAEDHQENELRDAALDFAAANFYRMRRQLPEESDEMLARLYASYPRLYLKLADALEPSRKRARGAGMS